MNNSYIWITFVAVLYASATLGTLFKFKRYGVKDNGLWIALLVPFFLVVQPVVMLLSIYVPYFSKDLYPVILKIRKLTGEKFKLPIRTVMATVLFFPLYTSFLARIISESQKTESLHVKAVWNETTVQFLPYMLKNFDSRIVGH